MQGMAGETARRIMLRLVLQEILPRGASELVLRFQQLPWYATQAIEFTNVRSHYTPGDWSRAKFCCYAEWAAAYFSVSTKRKSRIARSLVYTKQRATRYRRQQRFELSGGMRTHGSAGSHLARRNSSGIMPNQNSTQQRYRVVVPQGVRPGHNFAVVVNGQRMIVTCPQNTHAGQTIEIVVGGANNHRNMSSRDLRFSNQPPVNRTQRYRVRVPNGVRSGQRFRINVAGRLYEVVCPANASSGQLLELELPAVTQESLLADSGNKLDKFLADEKKKNNGGKGKDDFRRELKDGKVVWVAEAKAVGSDTNDGTGSDDVVVASATAVGGGLVRQLSKNGTLSLVKASEAEMDMKIHSWQGVIELDGQQLIEASAQPLSKKIGFFWGVLSSRMNVPWDQGHVKIEIRRQAMLEDSLNAFQKLRGQDFHKIFRFKFVGEEGLDAGGLAREWFTLVGKELFNPDFGLFSHTGVGGEVVMINPNSGLANGKYQNTAHCILILEVIICNHKHFILVLPH